MTTPPPSTRAYIGPVYLSDLLTIVPHSLLPGLRLVSHPLDTLIRTKGFIGGPLPREHLLDLIFKLVCSPPSFYLSFNENPTAVPA